MCVLRVCTYRTAKEKCSSSDARHLVDELGNFRIPPTLNEQDTTHVIIINFVS